MVRVAAGKRKMQVPTMRRVSREAQLRRMSEQLAFCQELMCTLERTPLEVLRGTPSEKERRRAIFTALRRAKPTCLLPQSSRLFVGRNQLVCSHSQGMCAGKGERGVVRSLGEVRPNEFTANAVN